MLKGAISIVFGAPFAWCLLLAVRGPLWWGGQRVFGDTVGRSVALLWVMAAALGSLWLGVSLLFGSGRLPRLMGAMLVALGSALLVAFHP